MEPTHDVQYDPAVDMVKLEDTQINQIAMAAWEVIRVWCEINDDKTRLPWDQMQGHLRVSLRLGVSKLLAFLNDGEMPSAEENHERWCIDKIQDGWERDDKYSAEAKKHPNLRPFMELPKFDQIKDTIFINTVVSLYNGIQALQASHRSGSPEVQGGSVQPPPPNEPVAAVTTPEDGTQSETPPLETPET